MNTIRTIFSLGFMASSLCLFCFPRFALAEHSPDISMDISKGISETPTQLVSYGSDTLANLMYFWGQMNAQSHPQVEFISHSEGSATAAPALLSNHANLGPMSRLMTNNELSKFETKFGVKPVAIKVAMDALVIYVHRNNPLYGVTLKQLDAIFSNSRQCGHTASIDAWHKVGLTDTWKFKRIELFGRNRVSGTHELFKQLALCGGEFKTRVRYQPGSTSLIQAISHFPYSIGFSGLGHKTSGVRTLPIVTDKQLAIPVTPQTILDRSYPLTRFLYIYVLPSKMSQPAIDFLKIALSPEGQLVVQEDGYVALSSQMIQVELNKLP